MFMWNSVGICNVGKPYIVGYCNKIERIENCTVAIFCRWITDEKGENGKCVEDQTEFNDIYKKRCTESRVAAKASVPLWIFFFIIATIAVYKWVRYRERLSKEKQQNRAENDHKKMQKNLLTV